MSLVLFKTQKHSQVVDRFTFYLLEYFENEVRQHGTVNGTLADLSKIFKFGKIFDIVFLFYIVIYCYIVLFCCCKIDELKLLFLFCPPSPPKELLKSHARWRTDLYKRRMEDVPIMDFFGAKFTLDTSDAGAVPPLPAIPVCFVLIF